MSARGRRTAAATAGRVIAGSARGIRLSAAGPTVRPLGDRLKEALFAILEPELPGAAFLDLCAGTGAGGIEALSRGAESATLVDAAQAAVEATSRNLAAAHLAGPSARVVRADALEWLASGAPASPPFDVILVDPPYDRPELLLAILERIGGAAGGHAGRGILAADGVLVAKHATRTSLPSPIGLLASARERRFGESTLTFYRWSDAEGR